MRLDVIGGGAFGTGLAIAFANGGIDVTLWARDIDGFSNGESPRLPGHPLPKSIHVTDDLGSCTSETALFALPTQTLGAFLSANRLRISRRPAHWRSVETPSAFRLRLHFRPIDSVS